MLSREQACAYVGASAATFLRVCPVEPRDMGANIVRYDRLEIDAWVDRLPPRLTPRLRGRGLPAEGQGGQGATADGAAGDDIDLSAAEDRPSGALDRVRARAGAGASRWKKAG